MVNSTRLGISGWCAKFVLRSVQRSGFRGLGGYSPEAFAARRDSSAFPQATREASLYSDFFDFFQGRFDAVGAIRGASVLDFGCGYGGRTVEYARRGGAQIVFGVEPLELPIAKAQQYAVQQNVENVQFRVCGDTTIPLPADSVDVVLSYDVLEHVLSPPASMMELHRVLKPGGLALLVFPVYLGMRSHHLDYMTTLPGLHWVLSAETLVKAVNSLLEGDVGMAQFGTSLQPPPRKAFDGGRYVLPGLNGLSGRHFGELFASFEVVELTRHLVLRSRPRLHPITKVMAQSWAPIWLRDAVTDSVACVLRKPAAR